jgi:hypothetical protein
MSGGLGGSGDGGVGSGCGLGGITVVRTIIDTCPLFKDECARFQLGATCLRPTDATA